MIRYVWVASLLSVLWAVLYIPSATSPDRFVQVLEDEHRVNAQLWGPAAADRIWTRMLRMQAVSGQLSTPPPATMRVDQQPAVDTALATGLSQMSMRLFNNPYFRSIDSLLGLATYRLAALAELLPILGVIVVLAFIDGLAVRAVRTKEFVPHSPEGFAASACIAILLFCAVIVSTVLPYGFDPLYVLGVLVLTALLLSRSVANYHHLR